MKFLTVAGNEVAGIDPYAALLLVAVLAFLAVRLLDIIFRGSGGRGFRRRSTYSQPKVYPLKKDTTNVHTQLEAVGRVDFFASPLLNREEARLLPVLEKALRDLGQGHRVMAQTSMGEILRPSKSSASRSERDDAFASINSKRLDFAIFDRNLRLVLAIEYQGTGHHQRSAFLRDAVKREALRRAGIQMLEVRPDFRPDQLTADLRRELGAR